MSEDTQDPFINGSTVISLLAAGGALTDIAPGDENTIPSMVIVDDGNTSRKSLEYLQKRPSVVRSSVDVYDTESFIAYVNRFARKSYPNLESETVETVIFGKITETNVSFTGVLDYHADMSSQAGRGQHRVVYDCRTTPEWRRWTENDGKKMNQEAFAAFIEDNAPDIVDPSSAVMIEVAGSLDARTTGSFSSATRLTNGSVTLKYSENVEAKAGLNGDVEIPTTFAIGVSPFIGFSKFRVQARLRYRISEGKLVLWYELVRPHKVVEDCGKEALQAIQEETGVQPFIGSLNSTGLHSPF